MEEFAPFDLATATRFCAEVPFQEHLNVSFVGKHGGFQPVPVFSARELVRVGRTGDSVLSAEVLAAWIESNLGDAELAALVRVECSDLPLFEQATTAVGLLSARLEQAEQLLAAESATAGD